MLQLRVMLLATAILMAISSPSAALDCRTWQGLGHPADRRAVIEDEVWGILESGSARNWDVNHNAIGRCVMRRASRLEMDIDDICDQGMRASMRAVDDLIMNYVRSCVH